MPCLKLLRSSEAEHRLETQVRLYRLSAEQRDSLLKYRDMLSSWGKKYSLASKRAGGELFRLVEESLLFVPHLQNLKTADLGSGAGLPGVPIAIARPCLEMVLFERSLIKANFLANLILQLKLENLSLYKGDWREHAGASFDQLTARASGNFAELDKALSHLGRPGARLYTLKKPGESFEGYTSLGSGKNWSLLKSRPHKPD